MKNRTVECSRTIDASPEAVFAVLTDLDQAPDVITSIRKVERLEGEGYEVGVSWRETRKMFGQEASEVMEVTGVDAPRSTTIGSPSHGVYYTTEFRCEPDGESTVVTAVFAGIPQGPSFMQKVGWAIFGATGMRASRKALEADLEDIAKAAEAPTD
ncbi:SRPBCC family protein [Demequina flava]|uniref:SRPBCC family protein n=1 Tax=Demequina flava TaxID=1095025 RepID=UPI000783E7F3|nr:SRPBCC family protein [Demequina flava]